MEGFYMNNPWVTSWNSSNSSINQQGRHWRSDSSPYHPKYKTEICRNWQGPGGCHKGSNCQFAHGIYELRPRPYPTRNSIYDGLGQASRSLSTYGTNSIYDGLGQASRSLSTGTSTYGMNNSFPHLVTALTASTSASPRPGMNSMIKSKQDSNDAVVVNWSPADDNIEVRIPSSTEEPAPREVVDAYISGVLYGSSRRRRRLPAFAEICPE